MATSKWKKQVSAFKDITREFIRKNELRDSEVPTERPEIYILRNRTAESSLYYFALFRFKSKRPLSLPDLPEFPQSVGFYLSDSVDKSARILYIIDNEEHPDSTWKNLSDVLELIECPNFTYPETLKLSEKQSLYRYYLKEDYPRKTCGNCHYYNFSNLMIPQCLHPESPIDKPSHGGGKATDKNASACHLHTEIGHGKEIKPQEVCFLCKYRIWAVGIGQGVLCSNKKNYVDGKPFRIPHRAYSCTLFSRRDER